MSRESCESHRSYELPNSSKNKPGQGQGTKKKVGLSQGKREDVKDCPTTGERERESGREREEHCYLLLMISATLEESCGDNGNRDDCFGDEEKLSPIDVKTTSAMAEDSCNDKGNCGGSRGADENGDDEKVISLDIETTTTTQDQDSAVSQEISPPLPPPRNCCFALWHYGDSGNMSEARGYALLAMGRGVAVMGNGTRMAAAGFILNLLLFCLSFHN